MKRSFGVLCLVFLSLPSFGRELPAVALQEAPQIDGVVRGDIAWQGVAAATGFTQVRPFEGQPSSQRTEVRIGYTDSALYVSVIAFDSEPERIVIGDARRDSDLDDIDSFRFILWALGGHDRS